MAGLTSMMNIGEEMEKKLTSIGIDSSEKLIEAGRQRWTAPLSTNSEYLFSRSRITGVS